MNQKSNFTGTMTAYSSVRQRMGRAGLRTMSFITLEQNNGEQIQVQIWQHKYSAVIRNGDKLAVTGRLIFNRYGADFVKASKLEIVPQAEPIQ